MYCSKCGTETASDANFCFSCGSPIKKSEASHPTPESSDLAKSTPNSDHAPSFNQDPKSKSAVVPKMSGTSNLHFGIIGGVAAFLVFIFAIAYFADTNHRPSSVNTSNNTQSSPQPHQSMESKYKECESTGVSDCYDKVIRPVQNKMESTSDIAPFRKATSVEIANLRCHDEGPDSTLIRCNIINQQMSQYFKLKFRIRLSNGSESIVEVQNFAPNAKWTDDELIGGFGGNASVRISTIYRDTLEIKDTVQ